MHVKQDAGGYFHISSSNGSYTEGIPAITILRDLDEISTILI
jgi:hypothetical protein